MQVSLEKGSQAHGVLQAIRKARSVAMLDMYHVMPCIPSWPTFATRWNRQTLYPHITNVKNKSNHARGVCYPRYKRKIFFLYYVFIMETGDLLVH
jgi:hypothetical protein